MNGMTVLGAQHIIEFGLDYKEATHLDSTEAYHYFSVMGNSEDRTASIKQEIRIDRTINFDEQFHIQGRSWGSEYWHHIDSVSTDWSTEK